MASPEQEAGRSRQERRDTGAYALLVAAALVVVIAGLRAASGLILPFLLALFLALVCLPLLNWLQRYRIPKPLAVLATLLAALGVLAILVTVIGGSIKDFTDEAPKYKASLDRMTVQLVTWLHDWGVDLSQQQAADFLGLINPSRAVDLLTGTLGAITSVLSNVFLVLLIIALILFEAAGFPGKLQAAFGRQKASERYEKIRAEVQRYLAIKSIISLTTGVLVGIALAIIGVDYAFLWGVLAFLLNYIPNLGSILAAIPPTVLALIQLGLGRAIAVAVVMVALNLVLGNFVEPYLMGRQLGLSTLVVFLSLVFWGWVWGPIGMLLSVPLTMILKIMLENTPDLRWIAILLGSGDEAEAAAEAAASPGA